MDICLAEKEQDMFCHECGAATTDGAKFCRNCGTSVAAIAPRSAAAPSRLATASPVAKVATVGRADGPAATATTVDRAATGGAPSVKPADLPTTPARRTGAAVAGVVLFFAMLVAFENVFVWLLGKKFGTVEMGAPWLFLNFFGARGMSFLAGEAASKIAGDFSRTLFARGIVAILSLGLTVMLIATISVESSGFKVIGVIFAVMYAACLAGVLKDWPLHVPSPKRLADTPRPAAA